MSKFQVKKIDSENKKQKSKSFKVNKFDKSEYHKNKMN